MSQYTTIQYGQVEIDQQSLVSRWRRGIKLALARKAHKLIECLKGMHKDLECLVLQFELRVTVYTSISLRDECFRERERTARARWCRGCGPAPLCYPASALPRPLPRRAPAPRLPPTLLPCVQASASRFLTGRFTPPFACATGRRRVRVCSVLLDALLFVCQPVAQQHRHDRFAQLGAFVRCI